MVSFAATDLLLAIAHHLLIFALAAVLTFEVAVFPPAPEEITRRGRVLWLEVAFFAQLPAFAAAMARGYGDMQIRAGWHGQTRRKIVLRA